MQGSGDGKFHHVGPERRLTARRQIPDRRAAIRWGGTDRRSHRIDADRRRLSSYSNIVSP
ncbi:MAG: hypothetical protein HY308_15750 [Gammaproteobacteria bacterium]|nr:hypothetical protein [Gammaproteobacteria bacterium]